VSQDVPMIAEGASHVAAAWFEAIVDAADLPGAWVLTDPDLQLALVQAWVLNTDRVSIEEPDDETAQAIVVGTHELWHDFARERLERWRANTFAPAVEQGWGVVTLFAEGEDEVPFPEMPAPGLEFVRLALGTAEGPVSMDAGSSWWVQTLTLRYSEQGWLVAGIGRTVAVPGWPPSEQELPTEHS
jgi:hypothetical protein